MKLVQLVIETTGSDAGSTLPEVLVVNKRTLSGRPAGYWKNAPGVPMTSTIEVPSIIRCLQLSFT